MNIKIGDKVRIKTEEELLADGWTRYTTWWGKDGNDIGKSFCGETYEISRVDNEKVYIYFLDNFVHSLPISAVAEVIPQTVDEYIYSLPLEERAKYFVCKVGACYYSILAKTEYSDCDEAIQATIEALGQPKE